MKEASLFSGGGNWCVRIGSREGGGWCKEAGNVLFVGVGEALEGDKLADGCRIAFAAVDPMNVNRLSPD